MADFFIDRSSELSDGGNILYTPNMTEMAATAKSNATAVTLVAPTDTKVTLTVDQWYEVSFAKIITTLSSKICSLQLA